MLDRRCGHRLGRSAAEQVFQPAKKTTRSGCCRCCNRGCCSGFGHRLGRNHGGFGLGWGHGRGCIGQNTLDDRCLLVGGLLRASRHGGRVFDLFGHLVAGFNAVQAWVVVLQALKLVMRRFQRLVGHQQHVDALLQFDLGDFGALFVEQERRHFNRHLGVHSGAVVLHGLFLDDAQDLQR